MRRNLNPDFNARDRIIGPPTVHLLIGLPRCGKSTWANNHAQELHATILSDDDIRRALGIEWDVGLEGTVWQTFNLMAKILILRGQNIIVDTTNHTQARRKMWIDLSRRQLIHLEIIFFPELPLDEWKRRCEMSQFPWELVEKMRKEFEPVTVEESVGT